MKRVMKLLMMLVAVCCLNGCGAKEVAINGYVDVTFEGYDTLGAVSEYEFNAKQLLRDYEKELEEVSKKELERLLGEAFEFDKTTELINGDEIEVEWNIDEDDLAEFEEEHGIKLVFDDFTIVVEDLEELKTFDPFEKISLEYEGPAPYASADINKSLTSDDVGYRDFYYDLDKYRNLSNGDVITVTVSAYQDDFNKYCIETYGMLPTATTKEFVVSGCPEYVSDVTKLSAEDITKIGEYAKDALKQKAEGWVFPESYCGMTYMGSIFAKADTDNYYSEQNKLYLVYKVDIDSIRDGAFSYYYYANISNLMFDEKGVLSYDASAVKVPQMTTGWFRSGTYFEHNKLYYEGYKTYDEFYADKIQPLVGQYEVTETVDKDIITKQTHTPKDYSKITASVKLETDCFTYKWYLGSYYVSGFTEKGYEELKKYSNSDYVSLELPTAAEDGSVVEGMYSSEAEGGYSFTKLAAEDVPCVELVCPDTYKTFYGFSGDYIFDENYAFRIKNVVLNDNLTEIANGAFRNCTGLEEITIPAKIEELPEQAFYGCSRLKKIIIPDNVKAIGKDAFGNCNSLVIDSLEVGKLQIAANAFNGVTLNKVTLNDNSYVSDRYKSWGTVYTPWKGAIINNLVIGETITKIPDYAFEYAAGIMEVTIPASVKEIGIRAFAGNNELKTVVLSEGLELIGEEAFYECPALRTINQPASLKTIKKNAFGHCDYLAMDVLDMSSLTIEENAFYGVTIRELILGSDKYTTTRYKSWGTVYTPWNGVIVKKITVKEGVTAIPAYAFEYCSGVTEIVLPATVTTIEEGAFQNCSDLKTIEIPASVALIGMDAFMYDSELTIIAPAGSVAEKYANEAGISFSAR